MKLKKLTAAMSVAMMAASGSAAAFQPDVTAQDYEINLSGATASTDLTRNLLIDNVCDSASPIDVFRRGNVGSFSNGWAVACRVTTTSAPVSANANVLFRKRDAGGSGTGVGPVEQGDPTAGTLTDQFAIEFMATTTTGGSPNCVAAGTDTTGAGTSYNRWSCGGANVNAVADAGFSDIEPSKFIGINTPVVDVAGVPTAAPFEGKGNLEVRSLAGLVFNTPVSTNLRNALQAAQGLTVGSDSEADMPSLPATLIRSLFTAGVTQWDKVRVDDGAGNLVSLRSHPAVIAAEAANPGTVLPYTAGSFGPLVHVCRRVEGSGTGAQFNAIFLNWPCDLAAKKPVVSPGNPIVGPIVGTNSGSSDMGRCLADSADGTNTSGTNGAIGPLPANRLNWAIGYQSTEKNTQNSRNYRYIKIDGAAPTVHNAHNGTYFNYAEQSMQWRNDGSFTSAAEAANIEAILGFIADNGTSPAAIADLDLNFAYAWGQGGWLVTPSSVNVPSVELTATDHDANPATPDRLDNPINTSTRAPFGQSPNTCQMPVITNPVQLIVN
jgi:hypothetical protein